MTLLGDFLHSLYDTLNELPDEEFEEIVYGSDLPIEEVDCILDHMATYLEGKDNE